VAEGELAWGAHAAALRKRAAAEARFVIIDGA
jgi:hypothetical protein